MLECVQHSPFFSISLSSIHCLLITDTYTLQARKTHPVLQRCAHNWATAALVRRYIKNRRKHVSKAKALAAARPPIQSIEDFNMISDEEEGNEHDDEVE